MARSKLIKVTQDIIPLSEFKAHASEVFNSVRETGRAVIITQNGKPAGVVIPADEFDKLREREVFIQAVEEGLAEAKAGRVTGTKDLEREMDQQFGKSTNKKSA